MRKTIKLTESDLTKIVKRVIKESMWSSTSTWDKLSSDEPSKKNDFSDVYIMFMKNLNFLKNELETIKQGDGEIPTMLKKHILNYMQDFYNDIWSSVKSDDKDTDLYHALTQKQASELSNRLMELSTTFNLNFNP